MRNALALSKHFDGVFREKPHAEERNSKTNSSNFRFQESLLPKGENFFEGGEQKSQLDINRQEKKLNLCVLQGELGGVQG